jgi:anti-sigma factor RsiW
MNERVDRRLLRYLHGELPAADQRLLQAELENDPALAARLVRLQEVWTDLQPAATVPPPLGAGSRLASAAWSLRQSASPTGRLAAWLRLGPAPPWARPLAGVALAAGVALGVWLGQPAPIGRAASGDQGGRAAVTTPAPTAPGPPAAATAVPTAGGVAGETSVEVPPRPAPRSAGGREGPRDPGGSDAGSLLAAAEGEGDTELSLAGEMTLAEAYLEAVEGGEVSGW